MPMWQAVCVAVTKITFWTSKTQKVPTNLIIAFYFFKQKFPVLRHITPTLLLAPLLLLLPLSLSLVPHSASGLHTILKSAYLRENTKTEPKDAQRQAGFGHMCVAKHLLTCLELDELFIFLQLSI